MGLLGGSFDPIHTAHLIVAQAACEALALDRLHLLVTGVQPLKLQHHAAADHRLAMARLATANLPRVAVDAREIDRGGPSYTVDTLRELRRELPDTELVLLLGSDSAQQLPRWREPEAMARLAEIVVIERPGTAVPPGMRSFRPPRMELSSTLIRARAAAGLPLVGWVPEAVADYISRLDLYRNPGGAA